ncbi:glutathione S-transferase [Aquamicrobium sp. LC103]|uniref:glutathione S-transferase n=1 Tax=Aquamicrobium sp. LC103 TaxID=1120658 RepID=UPI0009E4623E|nr:glutathione S-transferase [Aquamicrobium sp. LC103]TKT78270.1 glutathione S-transferase [Aquamicrobium sp. LC103]
MTVRLFHSPASPFVRKVLVVAMERGVEDRIEPLPSAAGPVKRDQTIVVHNPSGKVPSAILEDGTPLFDSRVICLYVDSLPGGGASLYPQDTRRFTVLTLEALADSILDAALLCRYERVMRPAELQWDDWYNGQMEKIDSGLNDLENRWIDAISGDFHAGAVAVACALGYLDFRFADKDWRSGNPRLASWFEATSRRPSMIKTMPAG